MKQFVAAIFFVGMVVGCTQDEDAAGEAVPVGSSQPAAESLEKPATPLSEALPEGVDLTFRHHVRSDSVVEYEDRRDRRRIGLDYLEGSQEGVYLAIAGSLMGAGFEERERSEKPNGNVRAKFTKSKFGTVIIVVTPVGDEKVSHADGKGRVLLDWPSLASEG